VDAGLTYQGLLPSRQLDLMGVAPSYSKIGNAARGLAGDAVLFAGVEQPMRDYETVLEVTYQVQIAPWCVLQPDLQFIFHPGDHIAIPFPVSPGQPIPNALVLGLRSAIAF
jgi:porin